MTKKYDSLKKEINILVAKLEINPLQGVDPGGDFYKMRLASASKGKGKSGGARVITLVKSVKNTVILL